MNKDLEYLEELENDLGRVIVMLGQYRSEAHELKNLKYTPQTKIMVKALKQNIESANFTKLVETIDKGVNSL